MQRRGVVFGVLSEFLPRLTFKHRVCFDRGGNELRPLAEDPAAPHRIVTDLTVTHIIITG